MAVAGSGEEGNMTGDFAQFDLVREIADSERKKPWSAGIHVRILTRKPDFRVVLVSMETAARLEEHHVDGTSAAQVLKGHIRYRTGGQAYDLQAGSLITLGASIRARGRIAGRIRIPADPLLAGQPATACFRAMKECASPTLPIVMTIRHSTRTSKEFIQLLKAHQVSRTVTLLMHNCGTGNLRDDMAVVVAITSSLMELKSVLRRTMAKTATSRRQNEFADRLTFSIVPVAPFRLDFTAWALRRRRQNIIDRWDGTTYRRVLPFGDVPIEVAVTQNGPCDAPRLQVTLTGPGLRPEFKEQAKSRIENMLGLHVDLAPFYLMASHDPKLLLLVEKFRGVKPPRFPTIFETLANAFACQQLSLEVGLGMLSRMACACGLSLEQDGETNYAFPRPEDLLELGPDAIRELGFSGKKTLAFLDLAGNIVSGRINLDSLENMDNEAVVASLLELRGVGRWTAEYVLLRGLKPLDVFPGDDVGARNRLAKWLQRNEPLDYDGVARVTRHWEPFAGVVYFHMLLEGLSAAGDLK